MEHRAWSSLIRSACEGAASRGRKCRNPCGSLRPILVWVTPFGPSARRCLRAHLTECYEGPQEDHIWLVWEVKERELMFHEQVSIP
jgi:hypothetical protein